MTAPQLAPRAVEVTVTSAERGDLDLTVRPHLFAVDRVVVAVAWGPEPVDDRDDPAAGSVGVALTPLAAAAVRDALSVWLTAAGHDPQQPPGAQTGVQAGTEAGAAGLGEAVADALWEHLERSDAQWQAAPDGQRPGLLQRQCYLEGVEDAARIAERIAAAARGEHAQPGDDPRQDRP